MKNDNQTEKHNRWQKVKKSCDLQRVKVKVMCRSLHLLGKDCYVSTRNHGDLKLVPACHTLEMHNN